MFCFCYYVALRCKKKTFLGRMEVGRQNITFLSSHFREFHCSFALVIAHLGRQRRKFNFLPGRGFTGVILVHFRRLAPVKPCPERRETRNSAPTSEQIRKIVHQLFRTRESLQKVDAPLTRGGHNSAAGRARNSLRIRHALELRVPFGFTFYGRPGPPRSCVVYSFYNRKIGRNCNRPFYISLRTNLRSPIES